MTDEYKDVPKDTNSDDGMPSSDEISEVTKERAMKDLQRLIRLTLNSPIREGPVFKVDGKRSVESFKKKNTDVKTRIILQTTMDAMNGKIQSAEWLMKYGGLEPPKEQTLSVELPKIIDDMTVSVEAKKPEIGKEIPVFDNGVCSNDGN